MLLKRPRRDKIYDGLHKFGVYTCVAIGLAASIDMGCMIYQYYTRVKPGLKAEELKIQQELLQEGAAERMQDVAAPL